MRRSGCITVAVQTLAGVLLPSATVFLLLLCNDKPVLGPWVNHRCRSICFTGAVIAVLVVLSMILTASVLFPDATNSKSILAMLIGGGVAALVLTVIIRVLGGNGGEPPAEPAFAFADRASWRMPALERLPPARLSLGAKTWMGALRIYLVVAGGLVLVRIVSLAIHGG